MSYKKFPIRLTIFLLTALFLAACGGAESSEPITDVAVETGSNQDLVAAAVATVEAEMPEQVVPVDEGDTAVIQIEQPPAVAPGFALENTFVELYNQINPSVVHIFVYGTSEQIDAPLGLGTGSGFVIDTEGHIVTNNHVVTEGDSFEVVFANGEHSRAQVIGTDVDSDLAVIKVDTLPDYVQPIPLGTSSDLQVGEFVIAIGNPFGETGSMSTGIISGLGRTLTSQRPADGGGFYSLPQVIQTDAAINPGNSGGPLLNLDGEVIGVNSAILSRTGTNSGVGFSIPVDAVTRIIPSLIENGSYQYSFIGISMRNIVNIDMQEYLELSQISGAYVVTALPDTPAAQAGLIGSGTDSLGPLPGGDFIIAVNGQPIQNSDDLISYLVFNTEVGQTIDLTVLRDGQEIILPLTLGARP